MPARLSLLAVLLLLSAVLFAAGAANGAPATQAPGALALEEPFEAEEEGEEVTAACDTAYAEADEGELGYDEAEEICAEDEEDASPAAAPNRGKPQRGKSGHRSHRHRKACRRHRAAGGKRHCPHRSRRGRS